jgi:hypothetical protein
MRFLAPALFVALLTLAGAAHADPADRRVTRSLAAPEVNFLRIGITRLWSLERLGRRIGVGLGWSLPRRWYDTDGQLLTERALLSPGDDLERSGLYLAVRF